MAFVWSGHIFSYTCDWFTRQIVHLHIRIKYVCYYTVPIVVQCTYFWFCCKKRVSLLWQRCIALFSVLLTSAPAAAGWSHGLPTTPKRKPPHEMTKQAENDETGETPTTMTLGRLKNEWALVMV